jgi:hypothetical protein
MVEQNKAPKGPMTTFLEEKKRETSEDILNKARGCATNGNVLGVLEVFSRIYPVPKMLNPDMLDLLAAASKKYEEITGEHSPSHEAFRHTIKMMRYYDPNLDGQTNIPTFDTIRLVIPREVSKPTVEIQTEIPTEILPVQQTGPSIFRKILDLHKK